MINEVEGWRFSDSLPSVLHYPADYVIQHLGIPRPACPVKSLIRDSCISGVICYKVRWNDAHIKACTDHSNRRIEETEHPGSCLLVLHRQEGFVNTLDNCHVMPWY